MAEEVKETTSAVSGRLSACMYGDSTGSFSMKEIT